MKCALIAAAMIFSLSLCAYAQSFTPVPTISVDGKKCLLLAGGVQCPGEGPKCISPCRSKSFVKDERPVCGSASIC